MSIRRHKGAGSHRLDALRLLGLLALAILVAVSGLDAAHAAGHDQAQALHPYLSDDHHGTSHDAPHPAENGGDCHGVLLCHTVVEAAHGTAWRIPAPRRNAQDRGHHVIGDLAAPAFDPPPPRLSV